MTYIEVISFSFHISMGHLVYPTLEATAWAVPTQHDAQAHTVAFRANMHKTLGSNQCPDEMLNKDY